MANIRYGFKASPIDKKQVEDRLRLSETLSLNDFFCELYIDGADISRSEIRKNIVDNLSNIGGTYSLHVPLMDHKNNFYDPQGIKLDYIGHLVDVANRLGSSIIILHRCWGFNTDIGWEEAVEKYQEWIWQISSNYPSYLFLVENFGFVFRNIGGELQLYLSPLDHFFPQEIDDFSVRLKAGNITNVYSFLDTAHANLTLNLLKAWRLNPEETKYFIHRSLHERINKKMFYFNKVEDYLSEKIYPYFHISDSYTLPMNARHDAWLDYFMSEGLVPGYGDIKWKEFFKKILELYDEVTLVMEVTMKDPQNGIEQEESIKFTRNLIQNIHERVNV